MSWNGFGCRCQAASRDDRQSCPGRRVRVGRGFVFERDNSPGRWRSFGLGLPWALGQLVESAAAA
jgi:hypothetical protein